MSVVCVYVERGVCRYGGGLFVFLSFSICVCWWVSKRWGYGFSFFSVCSCMYGKRIGVVNGINVLGFFILSAYVLGFWGWIYDRGACVDNGD